MRANRLKSVLAEGRTALNAWLSIGSSYAAEGVANQGFDSVTVDLQHGMIGFETALTMFQAISTTAAVPLARVPDNDPAQVMRLLDAGAYGLICPMISTQDEAWKFARACRYATRGNRSFGPSRGLLYGGADYFTGANDEVMVIPMIETLEAVENIDAILAVDEVDMLYIGPNDMALAYGEQPGSPTDGPKTAEAVAHVLSRTHAAGKSVGIFCLDAAGAKTRATEGFDLVTPGNDFGALTRTLRAAVTLLGGANASARETPGGH